MKAKFQTFRNPILSVFQSALHEALKKRDRISPRLSADQPEMQAFCQAIVAKINASAAMPARANGGGNCAAVLAELAWAEIAGNTERIAALENELMGSHCDICWTTYTAWKASMKQIPYVPYKNISDFVIDLPKPTTAGGGLAVGVIADWGTGMEDANWLLGRLLKQNVDLIIHLGDIYYSGTPDECAENFFNLFKNAGVDVPIYSLSGNHDMYSGGVGYYSLLQQLRQPASYFCLRNADWQILAMDTGFNDCNPFTVDTNLTSLQDNEAKWHLDKINNAGGRKTILLSHHQPFSPFGDGVGQDPKTNKFLVTDPNLMNVFGPVLDKVSLWLFGHEHNCNLFEPYNGVSHARCIGAGAIPVDDTDAYTTNTSLDPGKAGNFPKIINNKVTGKPIGLSTNDDGVYYHCFTVLKLAPAGGNSMAEYYQIDSTNNGQEILLFSESIS